MPEWNDEFIFQSGKLTISLSRLHYIFLKSYSFSVPCEISVVSQQIRAKWWS